MTDADILDKIRIVDTKEDLVDVFFSRTKDGHYDVFTTTYAMDALRGDFKWAWGDVLERFINDDYVTVTVQNLRLIKIETSTVDFRATFMYNGEEFCVFRLGRSWIMLKRDEQVEVAS